MRKFVIALMVMLMVSISIGWAQSNENNSQNESQNKAQATKSDNSNDSNVQQRLDDSAQIIQQMTSSAPDKGIPKTVLDGANCVAVIPNMIKAAFVFGGRHGSGFATCKTANGWSAPAPISITGASWGAQIGAKSTDLIMMVMNQQGMNKLLSGHFKVGGSASAAAGPVGRQASGSAGWNSAILTYSRSNGAFAGASLKGAEIQQDDSATKALYGKDVSASKILKGDVQTPVVAKDFVNAVQQAKLSASK